MIVYVKVNPSQHPLGSTWKDMAWRAWELAGLLDKQILRNSKKILIALSNKHLVASFCIHGVAPDMVITENGRSRRTVRFALEETSEDCHNALLAFYEGLDENQRNSIDPRSYGYIDITPLNIKKCDCILNTIPKYRTEQIEVGNLV